MARHGRRFLVVVVAAGFNTGLLGFLIQVETALHGPRMLHNRLLALSLVRLTHQRLEPRDATDLLLVLALLQPVAPGDVAHLESPIQNRLARAWRGRANNSSSSSSRRRHDRSYTVTPPRMRRERRRAALRGRPALDELRIVPRRARRRREVGRDVGGVVLEVRREADLRVVRAGLRRQVRAARAQAGRRRDQRRGPLPWGVRVRARSRRRGSALVFRSGGGGVVGVGVGGGARRERVGEGGDRVRAWAGRAVVGALISRPQHQARLDARVPVVDGMALVRGVAEEERVRPRVLGSQAARPAGAALALAVGRRVDLELEHEGREGRALLAVLDEADLGELEGGEGVLREEVPIALEGEELAG